MNTELTKVLDILAVIETYAGSIFTSLTPNEKLQLSAQIRAISPGADNLTVVNTVVAIYRDLDSYNNSAFSMLSLFDKLMIAAKVRQQETGGNATGEPVEAVTGVAATGTFTVGGETDSDIAEDDTITIGSVTLTAVADDATPGDYEFCIADDKDDVIENILACIDAIPGKVVLPWTAEAGDSPTITITAKETGTDGNAIATSIETEGDSAFGAIHLAGGVDEVEATEGSIGRVTADGDAVFVKTETGFKEIPIAEGLVVKTVKKTIGGVGVANCDFNFVTAANQTEQIIDLGELLPALCRPLDVFTHTNNVFTGAISLVADIGTTSGGAELIASGTIYAANAILATANGGSFVAAPAATAKHVYVNATPGANWSLVTAGKVTVYITYIDVTNV